MSSSPPDEGLFDRDTALALGAADELRGSLSMGWRAGRGPHGGYVAALMLRGLMMVVGDASRAPLTLTVHFLREPAFGPVALHATVERTGQTLTSLSAQLRQGDNTVALALATFAAPMSGLEYDELPMPEVEGPWTDHRSLISEQAPAFVRNLVLQPRFGRALSESAGPHGGGRLDCATGAKATRCSRPCAVQRRLVLAALRQV